MDLLSHVLLPVASETDARETVRAFEPYNPDRVTALYVVKKGDGAPAKTPVERSEAIASDAFEAVQAVFPDAETEITYSSNVIESIIETTLERDVSAIVYRSRGGGRVVQFLSGDRSLKLVSNAPVPVIALPAKAGE